MDDGSGSIAPDLLILGQSLAAWSVLITVVGGVYLYRQLLKFLRARAHPPESQPTKSTGPFSSIELERYARHIVMREIGGTGQKRLKDAKVLVVGAGGLADHISKHDLCLKVASTEAILCSTPGSLEMALLRLFGG